METLINLINKRVVLDLRSPYVCIGKLVKVDQDFLTLENADLHDFRDSPTTRENYVAAAKNSGIKTNRSKVHVRADEVVAVALFAHIIDGSSEE